MYEVDAGSQTVVDAAVRPPTDFAGLVRELVAERRAAPADDLITDLVGHRATEDEVVAAVVLLLNAGHEASVNVFGNGLVAMLRARAAARRPTSAATVEEMLRFDSALQLFERTATEDVEVGGVTVEAGQKIAALLGAANRDPAVFDDAGRVPTSTATPTPTWPSASACTSASARRWRGWSSASRCPCCSTPFPDLELAGEPESRGTFVLRGYRSGARERKPCLSTHP